MGKWKGPPHGDIPRCGAKTKTRAGHSCRHYTMPNGRCRFHGGLSTGAKNPHRVIKHGIYTKEAIVERNLIRQLLTDAKLLLDDRF
jgi:hypothetical protein